MGVCRIIPLGGLGEVGKNMTVYEADGAIVVVDALERQGDLQTPR